MSREICFAGHGKYFSHPCGATGRILRAASAAPMPFRLSDKLCLLQGEMVRDVPACVELIAGVALGRSARWPISASMPRSQTPPGSSPHLGADAKGAQKVPDTFIGHYFNRLSFKMMHGYCAERCPKRPAPTRPGRQAPGPSERLASILSAIALAKCGHARASCPAGRGVSALGPRRRGHHVRTSPPRPEDDLYPTPAAAIVPLARHLALTVKIWEPRPTKL